MNCAAWWFVCKDEDDVKWYRRHIMKKTEVVQWISDQQGRYSDDPLEQLIQKEEEAAEEPSCCDMSFHFKPSASLNIRIF